MERNQIIKSLIAEGFTLQTLVNMNDKQLGLLSERIITTPEALKKPEIKALADDPNQTVEVKEEETTECNKEISEEKPSEGLTKKKKSEVVKKAKKGQDIGKKGKSFKEVAKKAEKQYGSKEKGEKVAAAAMWKNIQREGKINEWVEKLVNENYHPIATKGEITSLIKQKLNESAAVMKFTLPEDTEDCVYADGVSLQQELAQKVANDNAMNKFNARFPSKPYLKHVETAHRTDNGDFRYIVGIKLKPEISDDSSEELEEKKK